MSGPMTEPRTATEAMTAALHRMDLPECDPSTDDYNDMAEHRIAATDLLDNLSAHGWVLRRRDAVSPLDAFASTLGNMGRPEGGSR